jgi:beta-lactam-binding protein with PASTA domain
MTLTQFFKKIFCPLLLGNCLGIVVVGALLLVGGLYFLQRYTNHGSTVTVPNVRGQRIDVVADKLKALGLDYAVVDTGYVDTYIGDVVLEQAIAPGEHVKPGRVIELTINASGARAIPLPQLVDNSSHREAEAKLRALGFKNIRVEYIPGDKDWLYNVKVNGQTVTPGERVTVTSLITLVVGDGVVEEEFNGNDSLDHEYFYPDANDSEDGQTD